MSTRFIGPACACMMVAGKLVPCEAHTRQSRKGRVVRALLVGCCILTGCGLNPTGPSINASKTHPEGVPGQVSLAVCYQDSVVARWQGGPWCGQ